MKNKAYILFILLASCTAKLPYESAKVLPPSKTTMMVRQARYISNTSTELVFEFDWYHVIGYNYAHLISNYFYNDLWYDTKLTFPASGFTVLDSGTYDATSVMPSSTIILIDESGTYDSLDHYNNRSQGIIKLCQDFKSPSQFVIGAYSKNGKLDNPVIFYDENFSTFNPNMMSYVTNLAKTTGGESNMYDAVSASIDKLITAPGPSKNIIIFAHAPDASLNVNSSLIAAAVANQIQIHIIYLGSLDFFSGTVVASLAEGTNGSFIACPTAAEMICAFENLYAMLSAGDKVYRLRVKYDITTGTFASGDESLFQIKTYNTYSNVDENPMLVYIKIP